MLIKEQLYGQEASKVSLFSSSVMQKQLVIAIAPLLQMIKPGYIVLPHPQSQLSLLRLVHRGQFFSQLREGLSAMAEEKNSMPSIIKLIYLYFKQKLVSSDCSEFFYEGFLCLN